MAAMTTARFDALQVPPKDPILGVKEEFLADAATDKINLSVGAYRTDEGTPWVLPPVAEARKRLIEGKLEHEYLPSTGLKSYCDRVDLLLRGKTSETSATVQGLSGTGGLRLCFEFLRRHHSPVVYVPAVTWSNHWNVLRDAGCDARPYAYLDGIRLDWPKLVADLEQAEEGAIILLHLCAHNPSGVDPTPQQWSQLCDLCKRKRFLPVFDSAYLGFASGDVDKDAAPFRLFCENGLQPWACISFSKNFGLYSERAGAIVASCASSREASAVRGHLGKLARALYSNPPAFGARVVDAVLADPALEARWRECLVVMSGRIADMRAKLRSALEARTSRDWWHTAWQSSSARRRRGATPSTRRCLPEACFPHRSHITSQVGMFSYTGLNKQQVLRLRAEHHVYMLESGRLSMAGVTSKNVEPLAAAIAAVL